MYHVATWIIIILLQILFPAAIGFLSATVYQIEPAPQAIERVQIGSLKVLDQGQRGCQDKRCTIP